MLCTWSKHFELVRIPAIQHSNGAVGCKQSHLLACRQSEGPCVVMEDDSTPTEWFSMEYVHEAMRLHSHWSYINMGPFLDVRPAWNRVSRLSETCSKLFLNSTYSHQTHFIMYNEQSLRLVSEALSSRYPLDVYLGIHPHWVPTHVLATQTESRSDIHPAHPMSSQWYSTSEKMASSFLKKPVDTIQDSR